MRQFIALLDTLLFAVRPVRMDSEKLMDPTVYLIETHRQTYCGVIIVQNDVMIKFRTEDLKPVKILKKNIKQVSIVQQEYRATA
jgi:hypothetical protein